MNRIPFKENLIDADVYLSFGESSFFWQVYKIFLTVQNYFISLFENATNDNLFEKYESLFFKYLWFYGEIVVTNFQGELQFWQIQTKYNNGLKLEYVTARLINENLQVTEKNYTKIVKLVPNKNCIYVCWNPQPLPAMVFWWDYCRTFFELEQQFLINTIWDSKRFLKYTNTADKEITDKENASFTNRLTPFVETIMPVSLNGKGSEIQNIYKQLDMGGSLSNQSFENLKNYQNYIFNRMGMMVPQELKKERKTTSESTQDIYNTLNIENITLRELKKFATGANKLWGLNLDFKRVTDLLNVEEEKEELDIDEKI